MDPLDYLSVRFPSGVRHAKSVQMMASHVTDAGVLDIYATVPRDVSSEASGWKEQLSAKQASSETETLHIQARQTEQTENIQREETWHVQREETEEIQQCGKVSKLPVFRP